jgi:hypothetical protein
MADLLTEVWMLAWKVAKLRKNLYGCFLVFEAGGPPLIMLAH